MSDSECDLWVSIVLPLRSNFINISNDQFGFIILDFLMVDMAFCGILKKIRHTHGVPYCSMSECD